MVAGVNTLTTVLNAASPFIVTGSDQTQPASGTNTTLLTPPSDSAAVADIANVFTPPASISTLATTTASVLLTEQAREKPVILEDPNPPLDTSSLGNLDIYDELLSTPLRPETVDETISKDDAKEEERVATASSQEGKGTFVTDTPLLSTGEAQDAPPSFESTRTEYSVNKNSGENAVFASAIAAYQQSSPALGGSASLSVSV